LDFPAGVIRVDTVSERDEREAKTYPSEEAAGRFFQNPIHKMVRKAMIGTAGLPVCVQVITLPYQEELCLQLMKEIENGRGKVED